MLVGLLGVSLLGTLRTIDEIKRIRSVVLGCLIKEEIALVKST